MKLIYSLSNIWGPETQKDLVKVSNVHLNKGTLLNSVLSGHHRALRLLSKAPWPYVF